MTRSEWFEALAEWHAETCRRVRDREPITVGERMALVPLHLQWDAVQILKDEGRDMGPL